VKAYHVESCLLIFLFIFYFINILIQDWHVQAC